MGLGDMKVSLHKAEGIKSVSTRPWGIIGWMITWGPWVRGLGRRVWGP